MAAALDAEAAAARAYQDARDALAALRQRAGYADRRGRKAEAAALERRVADAAAAVKTAKAAHVAAKTGRREAQARQRDRVRPVIAAARQARDRAQIAARAAAVADGLYWATATDVLAHHKTAARRIEQARAQGRPAEMTFRRHDGTGSIAAQLQRETGVTTEERAQVAALRAEGLGPRQIAERTRFSARTLSRMRDESPATDGDPPCDAAALAAGWKGQLALGPALPADYAERSRGQRRRTARQGEAVIRTGSGDHAEWVRVPVTLHRPLEGEAKLARLDRHPVRPRPRAASHRGRRDPRPGPAC